MAEHNDSSGLGHLASKVIARWLIEVARENEEKTKPGGCGTVPVHQQVHNLVSRSELDILKIWSKYQSPLQLRLHLYE